MDALLLPITATVIVVSLLWRFRSTKWAIGITFALCSIGVYALLYLGWVQFQF